MTTSDRLNRAIYNNATQMYVMLEDLARAQGIPKDVRERITAMVNMIRRDANEDEYNYR